MIPLLINFKYIFFGNYLKASIYFLLISIMALTEILTVGIVSLSVATVLDPQSTERIIETIHSFGFSFLGNFSYSKQNLLLLFAVIIFLNSAFNFLVTYKVNAFSQKVSARISTNLFAYFLNQDYEAQTKLNTSEKTSRIYSDGLGLMAMVDAFFQLVSRVIVIICFTISLLVVNFIASIILISILVFLYLLISFFTNKKFDEGSKIVANMHDERFSLIKNAFNSVKQLIIFDKRDLFISNFDVKGSNLAVARSQNITFTHTPRFLVESFIFISIILFCIFVLGIDGFQTSQYVALLSLYALSGLKLLPAFQGLFFAYASIKVHSKHLSNLEKYLAEIYYLKTKQDNPAHDSLPFIKNINFKNISFSYTHKDTVLKDLDLVINKNAKIGIVGKSGSGKSSLVDLLMCFYFPTQGSISIDGITLDKQNIKDWQSKISYVQQEVAIIDGSIRDNILFGDDISSTLESDRLDLIIRATGIEDLLLKNNIDLLENIGDSGSNLSGGQRQRIAIARALWKNREILILDEATSALDSISEETIIKNILDLYADNTVIMIAHRLSSLRGCEEIVVLDNGAVSCKGNWDYLVNSSPLFNELLTAHAH